MTPENEHIILVIVLMAIPVWLIRLGGFWLAGHFKLSKGMMAWLECLPGCILMAIVAPLMLQADWVEWVAAACVIIMMFKTDKLLYAMVVGIALAAIGHAFIT